MIEYVKFISETEVQYPTEEEFKGVINWQGHYPILREHGYLPLENNPEERVGVMPKPVQFRLEEGKVVVTDWEWIPIPAPEPPPEPDYTDRDNAEKKIVAEIVSIARKYDAYEELYSMADISIPALYELADKYQVTSIDLGATIVAITPMKWQLEAVAGQLWADAWNGLKSRFKQWMEQVN